MCGRTCLSLDREQVRCACRYKPKGLDYCVKPDWLDEYNDGKEYEPSYNIAPIGVTPVLLSAGKFGFSSQTDRVLKPMMWGIIPPWHKGDYRNHNLSTNNCRLENIKGSKLYGPLLKAGGRCVVVIEGYYEWKTINKLSNFKHPYYIYTPQDHEIKTNIQSSSKDIFTEKSEYHGSKLMYLAGLYSVWEYNEKIIYSYSIITMDSNETLNWLHNRMPAILDTAYDVEIWLDTVNVDPDMALSSLKPAKALSWYRVSSIVNNSHNKSADCNKEYREVEKSPSQKTLTAWFPKVEKKKMTDNHNTHDNTITESACKKRKI